MSGWLVLACLGAAALGVLVFLTLVAGEIRAAVALLENGQQMNADQEVRLQAHNQAA